MREHLERMEPAFNALREFGIEIWTMFAEAPTSTWVFWGVVFGCLGAYGVWDENKEDIKRWLTSSRT